MDEHGIPAASEVVDYLNQRLEASGLTYRVTELAVLPYVNPMWMANWDAPQLAGAQPTEIIDTIVSDARWRYPQILVAGA